MKNFANISDKKEVLDSIAVLEKELSAKTGKDVAVVAYSPVQYASLDNDAAALEKISELEKDIAAKTGKDVVLVAFSI
ncbi:MAG: hypothetical protein PUB32_09715 [Clostridiales bacterium]|nr:hypothetical protein [Clostridiales bacterium]